MKLPEDGINKHRNAWEKELMCVCVCVWRDSVYSAQQLVDKMAVKLL